MANDNRTQIKVVADFNFAMIPQWVILQGFSASAIAVYVVLALHRNNDTSTCFPSKSRIAEKAGLADNTITKALRELVNGGAIKIEERYNGKTQTSNLYTLFMVGPHGIPKGFQPIEEADTGSIDDPGGSFIGGGPGATVGGLTKENNKTKRTRNNSCSTEVERHSSDSSFDQFWAMYPKKVGKGKAQKAFASAVRRASVQDILSGCQRYVEERAGQDPKFTAHPTSWLNAERWTDEPDTSYVPKSKNADRLANAMRNVELERTQQKEIGR